MKPILSLSFLLICKALSGQTCEGYFPFTKGAIMEMTTYNDKNKPQSICATTILDVSQRGEDVVMSMHANMTDEKNKPISTVDYEAKCSEGSFLISMKSFVSAEQLKGWESMTVKMDADDISYPISLIAGQKLNDANLKVDVFMNDFKMPGMTISITNRTVEGMESITTPAGTFECVKISSTQKIKSVIGYEMHSIEWLSKGNGIVRSESYKGEKLKGFTVLTKLTK